MQKTDFKLKYDTLNYSLSGAMPVIIVAAGSSLRMGGEDKQLLKLCSIPVIARTLMAFECCPLVSRIIVVTKKESILKVEQLCGEYMISKISDIVEGGNTRHQSVMKGIACLSQDEKKVLIHDGARPLVSNETVDGVVTALNDFDAAVCTVFVNDTVKLTDSNQSIQKTLDRSLIRLAQTPQGIDVGKYIDACKRVDADSLTDDCAVMEAAGYTVKATDGNRENIKITTIEDIPLAEFYLREGKL